MPEGRRGRNGEESRLFWWAWIGVLVGLGDWRTVQTDKRLKIALRGKTRRLAANPLLSLAAGKVQTKKLRKIAIEGPAAQSKQFKKC